MAVRFIMTTVKLCSDM